MGQPGPLFGFINCWALYNIDYDKRLTIIRHFCTMLTGHVLASGINSAKGRGSLRCTSHYLPWYERQETDQQFQTSLLLRVTWVTFFVLLNPTWRPTHWPPWLPFVQLGNPDEGLLPRKDPLKWLHMLKLTNTVSTSHLCPKTRRCWWRGTRVSAASRTI